MILSNRVAIVTGGGTGIGKAISQTLAKKGARVAIASRNPAHLEAAAETLGAAGYEILPLQMDVTKKHDVQRAVAKVIERWGRVDILINNAGMSGMNRIDDPEDTRWYQIVETNLTGTYLITKEALKTMKDHAAGRVINISSVLGKFGVPGYTAYCASKHGVVGFTRALALEVAGRGITVNAICPGWVDTDMATSGMRESAAYQGITVDEFKKQAMESVPLKRFIDSEEVGYLALYLASEKAAGITGQAINICGGQTMV